MNRKLIIGIGNEGREDDGLGWRFIAALDERGFDEADLEYRYQLQVEDADLIAHYEEVLFVDADRSYHVNGFLITDVVPERANSYTSHALLPQTVLYLATTLYHRAPECRLLGITGESFDLKIGLTPAAEKNLAHAIEAFLLA